MVQGGLDVNDYKDFIKLEEAFIPPVATSRSIASIDALVKAVIEYLLELPGIRFSRVARNDMPKTSQDRRDLLYMLLTTRDPATVPIPKRIHEKIDTILWHELESREIIESLGIPVIAMQYPSTFYPAKDSCKVWQGDITTLRADSIVNAANSQLLGCFQPHHRCVDNAIHARAGPRVRDDCFAIMNEQRHLEKTGLAKITRAYNLPSRYIMHTVGPVHDPNDADVNDEEREQLASCYQSCLDLCLKVDQIKSIAFCSISTGVFGFPKDEAARIALITVADWIEQHPGAIETIIFNVFSVEDRSVYEKEILNWGT